MSALPPSLNAARARVWAWWIIPVVVLAALIGWETDWGRQVVRAPSSPPPFEPKSISPSVLPEYQIAGGLPAHSETVERTLFNATRRPAPVLAGDGGPGVLKPGQFQLMGTTVTTQGNIAFLKEVAGGKSRVVHQGERINGLLVASVQTDRVKFTLGDESEELLLKVAPGPKTTLVAAPAPPGAARVATPGTAAPGAVAGARAAAQQAAAANAAAGGAAVQAAQNARQARRAGRQGAMQGTTDAGSASSQGSGGQGGGRRNQ
jgi:hypothetical protein